MSKKQNNLTIKQLLPEARLREILKKIAPLRIGIVGDFCLDKYLHIDPTISKKSLETGLPVHQVTKVRSQPGGAGNVAFNVLGLGVENIFPVTIIGNDGDGFELKKALRHPRISLQHIITDDDYLTPVYTKPVLDRKGNLQELNRLDHVNLNPTSKELEQLVRQQLDQLVSGSNLDGLLIADQAFRTNCGVITNSLIKYLGRPALRKIPILVDSRLRPGDFKNVMVKVNNHETRSALGSLAKGKKLPECGSLLSGKIKSPLFLTLGPKGVLVCHKNKTTLVPTLKLTGELDICGAGDSFASAVLSAIAAGAELVEAAVIGNLAAAVTVQKLSTTGTASPEEIIELYKTI